MSVHVEDLAGYIQTERDITKILDDAGVELGGGDDPLPFRIKKLIEERDQLAADSRKHFLAATQALTERDHALTERDALKASNDAAFRDLAQAHRERDQLRRMHDGVSADLDRERREHQEAMAEAAASAIGLIEELEAARCVRDEAMRQRDAFMGQRDKAIRDAEFFKGEAETAIRAITKVQTTKLHERIAHPKRRSKSKTTKKPKVAAKRSRRKP